MSDFLEQRSSIKFCLRNVISAMEPFRMSQKVSSESTKPPENIGTSHLMIWNVLGARKLMLRKLRGWKYIEHE